MELVNTTCVPATLNVVSTPLGGERRGIVTAKASFRVSDRGVELDADDPFPLFTQDEPVGLGLLPRDDIPRRDGRCEVILLGAAHPKSGARTDRVTVELAVGEERRRLAIFGDRLWEGGSKGARIGPPAPFEIMPLVWERAFGGSVAALVDDESPVEFVDTRNPYGKGFDARRPAEELCRTWKAPSGYPVVPVGRSLPNIEDPARPITSWDDAPEPLCWATSPPGVDLHLLRELARFDPDNPPSPEVVASSRDRRRPHYCGHPDLLMDVPPAGTMVSATGVRPEGEPFELALPDIRVMADYVVGAYRGTRELRLETLVLLPEERRFYMVLRHAFTVPYRAGEERAMRLRVERMAGGKKS